jgi:uncharacterized SAM-binding protein YcdF (DUF218 family)
MISASVLLLAWFSSAFALDAYGRRQQAPGNWDAIVVPGAAVWRHGQPSKALRRRTLAAVELYAKGRAPILVLTGGLGQHPPAEAQVAARLARDHGVPEAALRVEERSQTTVENARYAREILGDKRVLVVTDAYHTLRCELAYSRYFAEVGMVGVPLGRRPLLAASLREVGALAWFLLTSLV